MTTERQYNQTEMGDWMEQGNMKDVPLQPGEAGWVAWHISQGPRTEDQIAMTGGRVMVGGVVYEQ